MEILLGILLLLSLNTQDQQEANTAEDLGQNTKIEVENAASQSQGIIVMEDIIAIVDTCDPINLINGFTVVDPKTLVTVYSAGASSSSYETYDLSQLSSGRYLAEATTTSGSNIVAFITVQ